METEFWGVEVKRGEPLKVSPGYDTILHLSQASLGEHKNEKGKESVSLFVNVDGKKLVLGTLITNKLPQHQFDLLFDREFDLSHDWKGGSVYFYGYKASNSLGEDEGESDESIFESDDEEYIPLNLANNGKSKSNDEQVKPELKAKQEKSESNTEQEKSESQVSSRSKCAKKKAKKLLPHETGDFLEKPEAKAQQEKPEAKAEQEKPELRAEQQKPEAKTEQEKPKLRDEQKKPEPNAEQEKTDSKVKRKKRKRKKVKQDKPAEAEGCNAPNKESDAGKDSMKITETHKDVNPKEDESSYEDLMSDDDEEDKSQVSSLSKWAKKKAKKLLPHGTDGNKAAPLPGNEAAQTPIDQANKQTPEPGKVHTCKTCNKSFSTEKGVEYHTKAKHGDVKLS